MEAVLWLPVEGNRRRKEREMRNALRMAAMAIVCWGGFTLPAGAVVTSQESELLKKTLGCEVKSTTCIVIYSDGGEVNDFFNAGEIIWNERLTLAVKGECNSACWRVVDIMGHNRPEKVCVMPSATFYLHQAFDARTNAFVSTPAEMPSFQAWIDRHGGLPIARKKKDALVVSGLQAIALGIRECDEKHDHVASK